jgi:small subunit ribosomal protein S23e
MRAQAAVSARAQARRRGGAGWRAGWLAVRPAEERCGAGRREGGEPRRAAPQGAAEWGPRRGGGRGGGGISAGRRPRKRAPAQPPRTPGAAPAHARRWAGLGSSWPDGGRLFERASVLCERVLTCSPAPLACFRPLCSLYRKEERWAKKTFAKAHSSTKYNLPMAGASMSKGIVLEKIGIEAKQPNSAIRKAVRVQLIKNGKKIAAFVPRDGCLNFVDDNDEVLIAGFGRSGHAVGDIPGVRFKVIKVAGVSLWALYSKFLLSHRARRCSDADILCSPRRGEEGEAPQLSLRPRIALGAARRVGTGWLRRRRPMRVLVSRRDARVRSPWFRRTGRRAVVSLLAAALNCRNISCRHSRRCRYEGTKR